MQLFMNLQMKGILQHAANLSILPSSNQSQLNNLNCPDTIKGYADSDPLHDADVKFFLDGSYRTHPQSSFFSSKNRMWIFKPGYNDFLTQRTPGVFFFNSS